MTHRERVVEFWDRHVERWLAGEDSMSDPLPRWFSSYRGKGDGAVQLDGFVEPYIGDLAGLHPDPGVVVLGLNPGAFRPRYQSRAGLFADQIRKLGTYSQWAATGPYFSSTWIDTMGRNRHWDQRVEFARRWLGHDQANHQDLIVFELYPWHSPKVVGKMRPPGDVLDEFVWQPASELPTEHIFAFGREWARAAEALELPCIRSIGKYGDPYEFAVESRTVRVYGLPSSQKLVVEWHMGGATPPSPAETEVLKQALDG